MFELLKLTGIILLGASILDVRSKKKGFFVNPRVSSSSSIRYSQFKMMKRSIFRKGEGNL